MKYRNHLIAIIAIAIATLGLSVFFVVRSEPGKTSTFEKGQFLTTNQPVDAVVNYRNLTLITRNRSAEQRTKALEDQLLFTLPPGTQLKVIGKSDVETINVFALSGELTDRAFIVTANDLRHACE